MKIVIIGGGPGGYETAIRASQMGAETVLIEKGSLGGTCLNVGCIPTKALLHSADLYHEIKADAKKNGILVEGLSVDFSAMQARKAKVVKQLVSGVGSLMKANNITVMKGTAVFAAADKIEVKNGEETQEVTFDKCIIASGSIPSVVPLPGHDLEGVVDSTGALAFEEIPESLAIIGGGVIGIEMAHVYQRLGTKVTVIEMLPAIAGEMEGGNREQLINHLNDQKVKQLTGTRVLEITDGGVKCSAADGREITVDADTVILAMGQAPYGNELLTALRAFGDNIRIIGDDLTPATFGGATKRGYLAAATI